MLHTALEFLKGILWILDLVDCLSCDSTDLGSGKLFCCGILDGSWILYPGYVMGS